jgi:hypothetical protein
MSSFFIEKCCVRPACDRCSSHCHAENPKVFGWDAGWHGMAFSSGYGIWDVWVKAILMSEFKLEV